MKNLYFALTFILQVVIFRIFGKDEQFLVMAILSLAVLLLGILLYIDTNKAKVIANLGWGMMYGSLVYFIVFASACAYMFWITISSDF